MDGSGATNTILLDVARNWVWVWELWLGGNKEVEFQDN